MARVTQCGALSFLGAVLVFLQLVVVIQVSKHTTVVDQANVPPPPASSSERRVPLRRQEIPQATAGNATKQNQAQITPADGSFNGIPISYNEGTMEYSTVACVGDNYQSDSWLYRSCQFRQFCFDTEEKEFVISQSPAERQWVTKHARSDSLIGSAVNTNSFVSLGGLNVKWGGHVFEKLKWFPRVLEDPIVGYYELPDDYVWVPYHSMAGFNAGHLVWDDFLPIHTLLNMFGLIDGTEDSRSLQPLLTRYVLKHDPLWATCDFNDNMKNKCNKLTPRFLPLMGVHPITFSTTQDFRFETHNAQSKYVCARYGAAGIGMLTDHATKAHGWEPRDYKTTHNVGRGASLYSFRNFMLRNLRVDRAPLNPTAPFHITFSTHSSEVLKRSLGFTKQIQAIKNEFPKNETVVHAHAMKSLSVHDQIELASKSAVFVTSSGGGAVTATFLPRGATLIIYYQSDGSRVKNQRTYEPARLDWDLFNHLSYIRVHWLPVKDMDTPEGVEVFTQLVRNELDAIARS